MRFLIFVFGVLWSGNIFAQRTPAPEQSQAILITGVSAHLGNGKVLANSVIAFEKGKITLVGTAADQPSDATKNYRIIEANGKHAYPGFIAPSTTLGLTEIDAVRSTRDMREVGLMNPSIRSIIAYNTDSKITPTVRSNGVLLAEVTPQGGRISGQSSVVQLDAWNWEDAAYATDKGIHLNWPRSFKNSRWAAPGTISKNEKYEEQVRTIEEFFAAAKAYTQKNNRSTQNLKMEACKDLFNGSKKLFIHAQGVKELTAAVLFARQQEITPVLVGARDAWRIIDFLKEHNAEIVLNAVHSLPSREEEDIDQPYKTAAALHAAKIPFCFYLNGSWEQRNLPFQAGHAVAYGLPYEDAVAALSGNTARILGIDASVGTLEKGKAATLFISSGDALDMRTCKVEQAFIAGRAIDLGNKQKDLDRKFRAKYEGTK